MIRWGHGHSTLLGVLVGAVLFQGWGIVWGLTCLFCLGVVIGRAWDHLRAFLRRGLPVIEGRARRL
jgi:hypothetical protein